MATDSAQYFAISRLNRSTRELVIAAHRGRGLLLRGLLASLAKKVSRTFASRRKLGPVN